MRPIFKTYTERQYETREFVCSVLFLLALAGAVVIGLTKTPTFMLTISAAIFTGAIFGSYTKRHTERGLWMLAMLFGSVVSAAYLLGSAMMIRDAINGHASTSTPLLAVDLFFAGMLVEIAARASWTVFVHNRLLPPRPARQ